jgi:hypothetical protein
MGRAIRGVPGSMEEGGGERRKRTDLSVRVGAVLPECLKVRGWPRREFVDMIVAVEELGE